MLWFYAALASYLFFAVAKIFDRYLLAGPLAHPRSYAFYAGITGIFALLLVPFGFRIPPSSMILISLFAGMVGVGALTALYTALYRGKVSGTVPAIDALIPIATIVLGILLGLQRFTPTPREMFALLLLIGGSLLVSGTIKRRSFIFSKEDTAFVVASAILFGLAFTLMKYVYNAEGFVNGFIWMRLGGVIASLSLLLVPHTRRVVFQENPIVKKRVLLPLAFGKSAGGLGFLFEQIAIVRASFFQLAYIKALSGVQSFFLLFLAIFLSRKNRSLLKEELTGPTIRLRIIGLTFIGLGMALLFSITSS